MTVLLGGLDVRPASRALLARANPASKLAVASVISLALILTVDPVTAGVALALELLALPGVALVRESCCAAAGLFSLGRYRPVS